MIKFKPQEYTNTYDFNIYVTSPIYNLNCIYPSYIEETKKEPSINEKNGWSNESTQGKTPITKEQAIQIWKSSIGNLSQNNIIDYENYTYLIFVKESTQKPNNLLTKKSNAALQLADFSRKVWELETSDSPDPMQSLTIYIDQYTGKIIGGYIHGD